MDAMNLLPVEGNNNSTLGAFGGALIGSWFGEGFGPNRRGYGAAAADTIAMDSLNEIRTSVNGVNTNVLTSANQIANGLCNLGYQGAQETASVITALNQGFGGLNTAIISQGYENRMATNDLASRMSDCCCETQRTIMAEGAATRALIDKYAYESLQTQLCDSEAKVAQLEANAFTTASNQAQTQVILQHLAALGGGAAR